MLVLVDILYAVILGLILSLVLVAFVGIRGPGPWGGFVVFFLVIFLGTWGLGVWISPAGPALWGASWLPFVLAAVILALVLAVAIAPKRSPVPGKSDTQEETAKSLRTTFGFPFWLLVAIVAAMLVVRYVRLVT